MKQDLIALDRATVRSFDENSGHLHVDRANLSRSAINEYAGHEIPGGAALGLNPDKIYRLFRDPAELEKAAKTIDGKPLLLAHKPVAVDDHDHANVVGSISEPRYDHPHLTGKLAVWTKEAIDAIQSGKQRELSCGYHYKYDPTPGSVDGQPYDGVMRDLSFNHCALVAEGRAGPTCFVGDQLPSYLKDTSMKTVLSRKAVVAQGALVAYLAPKMAKDAKVDLTPALKGITSQNFKDKKAALAADVFKQLNGKLAKDESLELEKVAEIIEAIAAVEPSEPEGVDTPPAPDPNDPNAMSADDDDEDLVKKLVAKGYTEEEAKKIAARTPAPAAADKDDDEAKKKKDDEDKKAMDALKDQLKGMVSKTAMDQALAAAVKATNQNQRDIRDAERFVRPWVGDLNMSFDSAPEVFRTALKALQVENVDKLHPDALRPILEAQQKPGDAARRREREGSDYAMDSAAPADFSFAKDIAHIRVL